MVLDLDAGVAPTVQSHAPHLLLPAQVVPVPRAVPVVLAVVLGDAVGANDPQVDPRHQEPERGPDFLLRLDPNPGELVDQTEHRLPPGLAVNVGQYRCSAQRAQPPHACRRRGDNLGRCHVTPLPRRLQDRHQVQQREVSGQLVHRVGHGNQAEAVDALRTGARASPDVHARALDMSAACRRGEQWRWCDHLRQPPAAKSSTGEVARGAVRGQHAGHRRPVLPPGRRPALRKVEAASEQRPARAAQDVAAQSASAGLADEYRVEWFAHAVNLVAQRRMWPGSRGLLWTASPAPVEWRDEGLKQRVLAPQRATQRFGEPSLRMVAPNLWDTRARSARSQV